ncbi:hypothetical protein HNQ02_000659 [Flavobacterium sp. 7E]|uniref:hypothetical protein n=1 Tax=Flavobacterium sp. 7E TaxID=2735898 RepID=UPI00156E8C07|nr:hypothetical protein [Flavobacterium sp. 7E]NRS87752.1 hypothetical protein [Flavobacterium sp. 7E]
MEKFNLLPLIDKIEKDFDLHISDKEMSLITVEKGRALEDVEAYYQLLSNIRYYIYIGADRIALRLIIIIKLLQKNILKELHK